MKHVLRLFHELEETYEQHQDTYEEREIFSKACVVNDYLRNMGQEGELDLSHVYVRLDPYYRSISIPAHRAPVPATLIRICRDCTKISDGDIEFAFFSRFGSVIMIVSCVINGSNEKIFKVAAKLNEEYVRQLINDSEINPLYNSHGHTLKEIIEKYHNSETEEEWR